MNKCLLRIQCCTLKAGNNLIKIPFLHIIRLIIIISILLFILVSSCKNVVNGSIIPISLDNFGRKFFNVVITNTAEVPRMYKTTSSTSSIDIKPTSGIVDAGGSLTLEISVNNTEESNVFEMVNVTGEVHFWQLNDVKNISKMNVEGTPEEKLQFYITFTGDETVNDDVYMVL
uniref:Uncharacterized protein n=1 Tax=Meloidogyne enterolobii TaxID=390850 RepID=A0A6V7TKU5_MELEN|nr:unnamed protein product [Meloidogyne enterolobii]